MGVRDSGGGGFISNVLRILKLIAFNIVFQVAVLILICVLAYSALHTAQDDAYRVAYSGYTNYLSAKWLDNDQDKLREMLMSGDNYGTYLVHGVLESMQPATIPELRGTYMAINIQSEEYDTTVPKGWDLVEEKRINAAQLYILGVIIDGSHCQYNPDNMYRVTELEKTASVAFDSKIKEDYIFSSEKLDKQKRGDLRTSFYAKPTKQEVTLFCNIGGGKISPTSSGSITVIEGRNLIQELQERNRQYSKTYDNIPFTVLIPRGILALAWIVFSVVIQIKKRKKRAQIEG